ncbi:hypothetical protein C9374_011764 [Naegleria lovaniensis]|uniref:DUF4116 domain-containing protein n=1 Tax=Naegleria lovaniensis TaxID=51637 RepID=A0AA88KEQ0_NAELO|nr:uncharacterized protein C9374_011764 [Naegleria lovaniensis]KAG2373879.1 hypothetical protein C9374_011764 [Naegleria lovaniensis]
MVLEVVKRRPFMLQTASKTLRNDKEVVLTAFMKDPWSLMLASPQLTEDQDIAMAALTCLPCKNDPWRLMSDKVKKDRDLLLKALTKNIRVMDYFSDEMKMDREFMLQCVAVTAEVMSIVPTSFQRDKTFMKEAIQRNGCVLKWVKGSIDPELELEAVKQNGFVLVNNYRDELFRARMEHCYVGCYLAHLHSNQRL